MRSQKQTVFDYLKEHKEGITSKDAFVKWGITRLSDIIYKLRSDGHMIISKQETTKTRFGNTANYSRYILEQ